MNRSRIKWIVRLGAAALILHFGMALFLTEGGVARLYPFAVRTAAEELAPSGNAYAVYYDARLAVSESEMIVLGTDFDVAESYDVMGHFLRFVKQYVNVGVVLLDIEEQEAFHAAKLLEETSARNHSLRLSMMRTRFGISRDFADFLSELYYVNATMTPVRKFTVESGRDEGGTVTADRLYEAFLTLRSAEKPTGAVQTAMAVVDETMLEDETFVHALRERFGDGLLLLKTRYAGGPAETNGESEADASFVSLRRFSLPFAGQGAYFVCGSRLTWFYRYVNWVHDTFGKDDGADWAEEITGGDRSFFFVIKDGTAVSYEKEETETEEPQEIGAAEGEEEQ